MEDIKNMESQEITSRIYAIRLASGSINVDYETAKRNAQPYLEELNRRAEGVAKRFNKKPTKFSFEGFGRRIRSNVSI